MTIMDAVYARHSVRNYKVTPIPQEVVAKLQAEIEACNTEGDLHIQLVTGEPKAFDGFMAHYGKFSGVQNYIALIGEKSAELEEKIGYYGERIALFAQTLGLNTCWVAMTFSKGATRRNCAIKAGEKLAVVLALGYGESQGVAHKSKPMDELCSVEGEMPDWFKAGMESVLSAPTAMNQQKFKFTLDGTVVDAKSLGGFYSKIDLGIVKYHFEVGAGKDHFTWK